tara:strand:- start:119 stop:1078 length:960 start_codon:yes stop_codon:yes gene_type:complete
MNHKLITDHIKKNKVYLNFDFKKWEAPCLIRCKSNNLFVFPYESKYWRAMVYIDGAFSLDVLQDHGMAYQAGLGLAKFHYICSDLDSSKLGNSIKNFHNTRYYINQYILTIKEYDFNKLDDELRIRIEDLMRYLSLHIKYVDSLLLTLSKISMKKVVIHGDPKLSNFLFDIQDKFVVSLIDLDTVTSGYLLTDLADCIRSISNLVGEDPKDKENVSFDINSCMYFIKGYFSINNKHYFRFIPEFIYLITFELVIRFLTDFLKSNRYFQVKYETHNLFRAEVQYKLLSSFVAQIPDLSNQLYEIGISSSSTFASDVQKLI